MRISRGHARPLFQRGGATAPPIFWDLLHTPTYDIFLHGDQIRREEYFTGSTMPWTWPKLLRHECTEMRSVCRMRCTLLLQPAVWSVIMPRPPRRGHSAMMLSDICLSVAYIGPKSRAERPRKTKIGTEVAHVTRDPDITFRVKRSRSQGAGAYCGGLPHSLFFMHSCIFHRSMSVWY